ncbi:hypothetical protein GGC65_003927 [Sphingopyxis sp. OAS728]|uniref:hypothetical protein n=1 Tax=Sphingopyxis sp. OAS728 TaxID=2663823 RepID=UPI00178B8784|nr:hypothetical protein [Sphingopyxis sp. OAS728]MBE1529471.1 hypothetical protein [Sphingopyxis sp. OAS728]
MTNSPPHIAEPESEAGVATAEQGIVMLDGPNGVAVSLTPEAAERTGQSLIAAAAAAEQQRAAKRGDGA